MRGELGIEHRREEEDVGYWEGVVVVERTSKIRGRVHFYDNKES